MSRGKTNTKMERKNYFSIENDKGIILKNKQRGAEVWKKIENQKSIYCVKKYSR